jgi:hypothetical protein
MSPARSSARDKAYKSRGKLKEEKGMGEILSRKV